MTRNASKFPGILLDFATYAFQPVQLIIRLGLTFRLIAKPNYTHTNVYKCGVNRNPIYLEFGEACGNPQESGTVI